MEFRNLKKQYTVLQPQIDKAIREVIYNASFIGGTQIGELEQKLAEYVGVKHCICCANGTDALELALMAWGIGEGDAVFVPDFTFFSSGEVVASVGATPIFVDVLNDTFNINPEELEKAVKRCKEEGRYTAKAIIAVDLFGQPADFDRICGIAERNGLKVLEDGAQGFGGKIRDKRACSFGDIATTSFFPAKPLGCYGDGGAVFTNSDEENDLIRSYQVHGRGNNKYDNIRIGMNSRLDTIQAAILQVKLEAFEQHELEDVNERAELYREKLVDIVEIPEVKQDYYSSWAQYSIKLQNCEERNQLQEYLKKCGIPSMVYYPKPMHRQQAFSNTGISYYEDDFKITNRLCERVLSLPLSPYIQPEEIEIVAAKVIQFISDKM